MSPGTYGRVKFLSTKYSYDPDSETDVLYIGQDVYDRRTGERLPPANMGEWYATHAVLSLCYPPWRDAAVGHLRRLGAVAPDQDPPLQGVDYGFPNEGWQSFIPAAPPLWTPRTLTATELTAALREHLAETIGYPPPREWFNAPIPRSTPEEPGQCDARPHGRTPSDDARRTGTGPVLDGMAASSGRRRRRRARPARHHMHDPGWAPVPITTRADRGRLPHYYRIGHTPEPGWPWHPNFTPSGRLHADWELEDGTFVELAGLSGDAGYDARMARKRLLAEQSGIDLLVIEPDDIRHLPTVFDNWL